MPKKEDAGKFLKVECIPTFAGTEYPSIFAITSPISPGMVEVLNMSIVTSCWLVGHFRVNITN